MRQPTHFIEVVRWFNSSDLYNSSPNPIHLLKWALGVTKRLDATTIAIFKIYPKNKKVSA